MAEINIEPRPRRSAIPFLLGMLIVAAIAVGVWYFMGRGALGTDSAADAPEMAEPAGTPPPDTSGY
jgi:hypothetical protein